MDIRSIKAKPSSIVTIIDPISDVETDIKIELLSPTSKEFKKLQSENSKIVSEGKLSNEEIQKNAQAFYARCVLSWENVQDGKKQLPCTFENALSVFSLGETFDENWIYIQVAAHYMEKRNFLERIGSD